MPVLLAKFHKHIIMKLELSVTQQEQMSWFVLGRVKLEFIFYNILIDILTSGLFS